MKDDLRRRVDARQLNLMQPWSLGTLDIVFIRNVLIYFDGPGKASILQRVYSSMSEGGYLFLGGAETPSTPRRSSSASRPTARAATGETHDQHVLQLQEFDIEHMADGIWSSVLGIAIHRCNVDDLDLSDALTGIINITGDWRGSVVLSCHPGVARRPQRPWAACAPKTAPKKTSTTPRAS